MRPAVIVNKPKTKERLSDKTFLELRRKSIHIAFGALFCYLIYFDKFSLPFWFGVLFAGVIISLILRRHKIPLISRAAASFERENEIKNFPLKGALTFIFGCIFSYLLFATPSFICRHSDYKDCKIVAIASIFALFIGDSWAAIYGTYLGRIVYRVSARSSLPFRKLVKFFSERKHLDATIFSIVLSTVFISLFFPLWKSFLVSFITFFIEALDFRTTNLWVDDNIYLPVISGLILALL
ncbi:MAG: hypothetical protein V1841_01750 [Patescibacteria group bacterium]